MKLPDPVPEALKPYFQSRLDILNSLRNQLLDHNATAIRWLMATLVTLNAGAAAATMASDKVTRFGKLTGGMLFCFGTVTALIIGYFTLLATGKMLKETGKAMNLFDQGLYHGKSNFEQLKTLAINLNTSFYPWRIAIHVSGIVSLILWLCGAVQIGLNLK